MYVSPLDIVLWVLEILLTSSTLFPFLVSCWIVSIAMFSISLIFYAVVSKMLVILLVGISFLVLQFLPLNVPFYFFVLSSISLI